MLNTWFLKIKNFFQVISFHIFFLILSIIFESFEMFIFLPFPFLLNIHKSTMCIHQEKKWNENKQTNKQKARKTIKYAILNFSSSCSLAYTFSLGLFVLEFQMKKKRIPKNPHLQHRCIEYFNQIFYQNLKSFFSVSTGFFFINFYRKYFF